MKNIFLFMILVLCLLSGTVAYAAGSADADRAVDTADYWCTRDVDGETTLMTQEEIHNLNALIRQRSMHVVDLENYPENMSGNAVRNYIRKSMPAGQDFYVQGRPLTFMARQKILAACGLDGVQDENPVRYAVTVRRVNLRLLPTEESWSEGPADTHTDVLQATAVDPAEPVAVLARSTDGTFYFVQMRNYRGWLAADALAFAERDKWLAYVAPQQFLVVTKNLKKTKIRGQDICFQMGSRIPFIKKDGKVWLAVLPQAQGGRLKEKTIKLRDDGTLHEGWLPYTRNALLRQAFGFLGDAYGWGGLNNSVDCSSFVADVYRTVGIELPRNANQQERVFNISTSFTDMDSGQRMDALRAVKPGELIFMDGHVMMFLGCTEEGTPMVIHAPGSFYTFVGDTVTRHAGCVSVSDVFFRDSRGQIAMDLFTSIGSMK